MIIVSPLHELQKALEEHRPSHILSLSSPGALDVPLPDDAEVLRLQFHDISEPRPGLSMVTREEVSRILDFGRVWPGRHPLLIHCWAGVSRSPAAAYAIASLRAGSGREKDLAGLLRRAAPFATPNPLMVVLADEILGRNGEMRRSIAEIGRGQEVSLGRTFKVATG